MKTISVREAQHQLAAVLDRVAAGESIEITRHRRAIARIVPLPRAARPRKWPDLMARLRADYGQKVTPDSAPLFEELRGER